MNICINRAQVFLRPPSVFFFSICCNHFGIELNVNIALIPLVFLPLFELASFAGARQLSLHN